MWTPWGKAQGKEKLTVGINFYSTAGHGGYHLSKTKNVKVPAKWRLHNRFEGWYEEDCGWAPLALTFPELFPNINPETLEKTIAMWEDWVKGR